jgi:phage shock protein PspC (stress-responsive transcriptional regulator)
MEKTLTINISGWVFNISEEAYEKLTQYFNTLKKYFKNKEGSEEIVADIEARIAELFKERIANQNAVIIKTHVEEVIGIMGQPFEMDDEEADTANDYSYSKSKTSKSLFRDTQSGHIAGVASGLGKFLNLDPIILRIIFLLLVPTGGAGIIIYLVMWVLIPEAKTTSDRIRMEGKKVNIKNIEDKVKEETDYLKGRINEFSEEAKDIYRKTAPARKHGLRGVESMLKFIGRFLLRVLKILLGFVLFIYGLGLLIGFAMLAFNWIPSLEFDSFSIYGMSLPSFLNSYVMESSYGILAIIALSIVIFIPIVMMIFHGIRFLFNLKRNKTVGKVAWQSWVLALIVAFGISYTTITSFKEEKVVITKHELPKLKSDTLQLRINTNKYYANVLSSDKKTVLTQDRNIPILRDGVFYGEPTLRILNSDNQSYYLKLYQRSRGNDEVRAEENIYQIKYNFLIDSMGIVLDPYFFLKKEAKWRAQDVEIRIYLPDNKAIMIDKNIRKHFNLSYFWSNALYRQRGDFSYWINNNGKFEKSVYSPDSPIPYKEDSKLRETEKADKAEVEKS